MFTPPRLFALIALICALLSVFVTGYPLLAIAVVMLCMAHLA